MSIQAAGAEGLRDDVWVKTFCDMCYCACGVQAHRVNGVIVKIEGDPDCPHNWGKLCAKGQAALMGVYDPNRVTVPLKRTNPEKGIGVDPGWVGVSWEEALEEITQRLARIRSEDPRRLFLGTWDQTVGRQLIGPWAAAFGTPNHVFTSATYFCGNALHQMTYLINGTFHSEVDLDYCNYCILWGNQHGFMVGVNANINSQKMAEARMRGMKVVVVDPLGSNAAAKADEWIPIRPGTDAALALAMLNLLINEYGLYDTEFLRHRTNASYLTGPDGHYVRDPVNSKPLVWDQSQGQAVPFDQASLPALEGGYTVAGTQCLTAFQRLREHLRQYTPDRVETITTVPAATIRRIAREFGEAARIGSRIVIEGKELPLRPAVVQAYRGAQSHKHGTHIALALQLLNLVMGNIYAPGGHRGVNFIGPSRAWAPLEQDGLMVPHPYISVNWNPYEWEVKAPDTLNLRGLFPAAHELSSALQLNLIEPEKFKVPYQPEALLLCRTNPVMSRLNRQDTTRSLKSIPFFVYFATHLDEVADFADFFLPDAHSLERLDYSPHRMTISVSPSTGHWYWGLRQPVVPPAGQARPWREVLLELAERLGFQDDIYQLMNMNAQMPLKGEYRLQAGQRYTWEDIFDRAAKSQLGPDKGLDWLKEHGFHKKPRTVEETYPGPFVSVRYPVYYEQFLRAGEEVRAVTQELDIPWDVSDYQALPHWKPCPAYEDNTPGFDFYAINYKLAFHFQSWTSENPWLTELGERHPYAFKVMLSTQAAGRLGIRDGDRVAVESVAGKVVGRVRLSECIHPEVVGIAGTFGGWSEGRPVARGKGVHFNTLLPYGQDRVDPVSAVVDACIKVKVYKAPQEGG